MIRYLIAFILTAFSLTAFSLTDPWGVDVQQHTAVQRTYKQGESVTMQISLRDGLKPLDLTGATARWYWYTNANANVWWTNAAAIPAPKAGLVTAQWTPAMDVGAASYAYWVGIWMPGATSPLWRVTGTLRLLTSPGFTPNALPMPVRTLDFAAITITNAPWVTSADFSSALQSIETNTSARISAAMDSLSTNRTVKLYSPEGTQWIDGTGGVWRVSTVTNTSEVIFTFANNARLNGVHPPDAVIPWGDSFIDVGGILFIFNSTGATALHPSGDSMSAEEPLINKTLTNNNGASGTGTVTHAIYNVTSRVDGVAFRSDLAAVEAALASNRHDRIYSPDGTQIIDGTGGVWRISATATNYTVALSENFESVYGVPRPFASSDFPFPLTSGFRGYFQTTYNPNQAVVVYGESGSVFARTYWQANLGTYPLVLTSSSGSGTATVYQHFTFTTSIVDSVAFKSDLTTFTSKSYVDAADASNRLAIAAIPPDDPTRWWSYDTSSWMLRSAGTISEYSTTATNRWYVKCVGTSVTNGTFEVLNAPALFTQAGRWTINVAGGWGASYLTNSSVAVSASIAVPWNNYYATQLPQGLTNYTLNTGAGASGTVTLYRVSSVITNNLGTYYLPQTPYPTNYIAGFALPIPGTNVVYTLSVDSNRTLSVWEVLP
jgi:hypothetical protein